MLIAVLDLERGPLCFDQTIASGAINYGSGVTQVAGLPVQGSATLIAEHRGPRQVVHDIRLCADCRGRFEVLCARCLDPVEIAFEERFDLLFRPLGADAGETERAISTSDTEIGYYQGGGLVLEDVLRERVLLFLPPRALCREDCKGLCPGCGRNLNAEVCACDPAPSDARWLALADLRSRMKT